MRSKLFLALALVLPGCAHVSRGLDQVQAGLAKADMATDEAAEKFLDAVTAVRAACELAPDPDKCMDDLGLGEDDLAKVCVPGGEGEPACIGGAAADLDQAYKAGAKAAADAAKAWGELEPHLKAAEEAAKEVKDGLAD